MLAFIFWTCYIGLPAKKRLVEESTEEAAFQEKSKGSKKVLAIECESVVH